MSHKKKMVPASDRRDVVITFRIRREDAEAAKRAASCGGRKSIHAIARDRMEEWIHGGMK